MQQDCWSEKWVVMRPLMTSIDLSRLFWGGLSKPLWAQNLCFSRSWEDGGKFLVLQNLLHHVEKIGGRISLFHSRSKLCLDFQNPWCGASVLFLILGTGIPASKKAAIFTQQFTHFPKKTTHIYFLYLACQPWCTKVGTQAIDNRAVKK